MKTLRFIAASEIAGGSMLLVITVATWLNFGIPLWYQIASVLLAFYAIIAGISLWKNTPLGHWLSLPLQGVQVFRLSLVRFFCRPLLVSTFPILNTPLAVYSLHLVLTPLWACGELDIQRSPAWELIY
jgi:hypothetical protein